MGDYTDRCAVAWHHAEEHGHKDASHYAALGRAAWDAGTCALTACPFSGWQGEAWKDGLWKRRAEALATG